MIILHSANVNRKAVDSSFELASSRGHCGYTALQLSNRVIVSASSLGIECLTGNHKIPGSNTF